METKYIIFGASGDLSKRYLLPALEKINVDVIKVSRKDYADLKNLIPAGSEKIFHLAIPPQSVPEAVELISKNFGKDNIKILLEKPFGKDLKSAQLLVEHIDKYFSEDQIYRVDHYLAKKSFQNVLQGNLDAKNIKSIKIIAVVCDITKNECVKRAQYEGYREEVQNMNSMTETFVSVNLISDNIPISLTTGKALKEKLTRIEIDVKSGSQKVFNIEHETDAYERVIRAAIKGECDLFISSGEVLESWRILEDIQNSWKNHDGEIAIYKKGSSIEDILG